MARGNAETFALSGSRRPNAAERRALARYLAELVRWHATLERWPRPPRAPDAVPFVSLYARGQLIGCFGAAEGTPGARIARAFLKASTDARFAGAVAVGRANEVAAQLSYVHSMKECAAEEAIVRIDPGAHGVGLPGLSGSAPIIVLPHVACDGSLDAEALVGVLFAKAGRPYDARARVILFETDEIASDDAPTSRSTDPMRLAASWLSAAIDGRGHVTFAIDPRARTTTRFGAMHHARAAVVVHALAGAAEHAGVATRARRHLEREIRAALSGQRVEAWPQRPAEVAGTVALAVLAGADLKRELEELAGGGAAANARAIAREPWYAAQVVAALGRVAHASLFEACVADLDRRPFAPWTLLAARQVGEARPATRVSHALVAEVGKRRPQAGTGGGSLGEVAMAALVAEVLAREPSRAAQRAVTLVRRYLLLQQLIPGRIRAALDASLAKGAFPLSPIHGLLRADVTAHALLALRGASQRAT